MPLNTVKFEKTTMEALPTESERFSNNVRAAIEIIQDCLSELYSLDPQNSVNPLLVKLAAAFLKTYDNDALITGFIRNSHQFWDKIKIRDEAFFSENAGEVFKELPMDKVNVFKQVFTARKATGELVIKQVVRDQIWSLFEGMVRISIKYVHKNRDPYTSEGEPCYGREFLKDVDVERHSGNWNLKLVF